MEKFSTADRDVIQRVIRARRDIRHFTSTPVSDGILLRILGAAHAAPSVGLMQPWDFILVNSPDTRSRIRASFESVNASEKAKLDGTERGQLYNSLKLEGILEAPVNIAVTCDHSRGGPFVLGRAPMPQTATFGVCLAIENLWLAARAEGIGVGWVSILDQAAIEQILGLPPHVELIAYLCMGYPVAFGENPMLEEAGWRKRAGLETVMHRERWGAPADPEFFESREKQRIPPPDMDAAAFTARAWEKIDHKTKPPRSLGKLEKIAVRLAQIQGTFAPTVGRKRICIFAASHGVAAEGVSAYPTEVTGQMVLNFLGGGAAINVLARHGDIDLHVIDVGVDGDSPSQWAPNFHIRKSRRGTRNFAIEPAMTPGECEQAMEAGREQARLARAAGIELLGIGEMGIGNTTSASALFVALLGITPGSVVGRGTGVTDEGLQRKLGVIEKALELHKAPAGSARARHWLEAVGGFEIAAMAGVILEAAACGLPVVIDGFIATAAAAVTFDLDKSSREVCFFSHRSDEQAHGRVLAALDAEPLLDLQMRLGEGTGAALAMHLIEAAAKIMCEMATFDSAGVSGPVDSAGASALSPA
jgi:nicotinate-nucleotide--dimethylbenzimidazole phosphoribosyltransferase